MLKYSDYNVGFEEIPERVSLNIFITNCPFLCEGCHSPELREDIGTELTSEEVEKLLYKCRGITCVTFMGDGCTPKDVITLGQYLRDKHPGLDIAVYSGREEYDDYFGLFSFIKLGAYRQELGAINTRTTNQRMYQRSGDGYKDITPSFWARYNR